MIKKIDLIQPRHSYAKDPSLEKIGQIYSNTSLRTVGSILDAEHVDVTLHDENVHAVESLQSNIIGLNLLWAPYIPVVIETMQRLKKNFWNDLLFVLWWQVLTQKKSRTWKILGLDDSQFKSLFWDGVVNGMKPWVLESLLDLENLPDERGVSLVPMYKKLSDEEFKVYFSREISLYVSQGCKFTCDFCAAEKNQKEKYREAETIEKDLFYIMARLQDLWEHHLDIYMSNLDVFQSPDELEKFADMMWNLRRNISWFLCADFTFSFRGLAGTKSFVDLEKNHPKILEKLVAAGFNTVGYGVDGMWPDVWKGIKKPQNDEKNILDAIRISKEKYNITPELLMVFGHVGVDTEQSLKHAYDFVEAMVDKYGAIPRPHIAKQCIPGNDGRSDPKFQKEVNMLIENPTLFQSLDFTALASKLTHPDKKFRDMVNHYYLEMCKLPGNTTQPIIPYDIWDTQQIIEQKKKENIGKFDR
jgi:hypothetical protein